MGYQLYQGDCLDLLPTLAAGSVDAIVTDPPYGINVVSKRGHVFGTSNACAINEYAPVYGDDRPFDPSHLLDIAPIAIIFGGNYFAHRLPPSSCWLVWDKRDGFNPNPLADCELAWTNIGGPSRLLHHHSMGMIRRVKEPRYHPTQKPVGVMRWAILQAGLPPGATILDPYMGSGSSGVAALELGYNFIGIEYAADYLTIAERRLAGAQPPLPLAGD